MSERLSGLLQKLILICIILILVGVPAVFYPGSFERYPIPKTTFFKILLLISAALWVFRIILEKKVVFKRTALDIPIFLYLFVSLLSYKNALNPYLFESSIIFMIFLITLYYLTLNNIKREWVEKILFFSAITAIGVSLFGIYQYMTTSQFNLNTTVISTLGHSNFLAQYLIAVIPFSLVFFIKSSNANKMLFWGVGILIIFSSLILTFARGGWLGFLVSTGVFIALYRLTIREKKKRVYFSFKTRIVLLLIVIIILGVWLISSKPYILKSILVSPKESLESTNSGRNVEFNYKILTALLRIQMWKGTLNIIEDYPVFGVGLGNYAVQSPRFRTWKELTINKDILWWAHNDYLQIAAETGIVGLCAFLFLIGSFFYKGIKGLSNIGKDSKITAIGLISSLSATLTHSFFSFNLYQITPTILFWLSMGLVMVLQEEKEIKIELPDSKSFLWNRFTSSGIFIIVFVLLVFGIYNIAIKPFLADLYYTKGETASINGQWEESVQFLKEANSLAPSNPKYRYAFSLSLYRTGDLKGSIENGEIAYRLTPFIWDLNRILCLAHNEVGNNYATNGKLDLALKQYNTVINLIRERGKLKLRPHEVSILERELSNAYYNRGNIFFRKKLYQKALDDYDNALKITPEHYYALKARQRVEALGIIN